MMSTPASRIRTGPTWINLSVFALSGLIGDCSAAIEGRTDTGIDRRSDCCFVG